MSVTGFASAAAVAMLTWMEIATNAKAGIALVERNNARIMLMI
jgi:hypothetical protein